MQVECSVCGNWHRMTPTAMAVVIRAFQDGDLHTVNSGGIDTHCILTSFNPDAIEYMQKRYPKHVIEYA